MGYSELFTQRTFAEDTERLTGGAAEWQEPSEIRLEKVTGDGSLVIRRPASLEQLPAPWSLARAPSEVMIELKLPGNHLDRKAVARTLLRRQALEVQLLEEHDAEWVGEVPLWLVAPHLPEWLQAAKRPVRLAPGCYCIEPDWFLWIAANELPLLDPLVPFLMARSGQALDEFSRWVATRRPLDWVISMLEYLPMSTHVREDLLWRFGTSEDPEIEARRQRILDVLLAASPKTQQQLIEKGIEKGLTSMRASLRRVLARRHLMLGTADDARIEACSDLATLERWLDQAITAASVAVALA